MSKKTFLGAMAVVTTVALTGSALVASNMGFKLNHRLAGPETPATGDQGQNAMALPDNRKAGLSSAKSLMDDIGSAQVAAVQKYVKASDSYLSYTGRKSSPNGDFPLVAGEGYFVRIFTTNNYIIAGSDDPALSYMLAKATAAPDNGSNFFAYNYHQTAASAKALMDDIGSANVLNISGYLKATNSFQSYTGRKSSPNANYVLQPGEGYYVKMSTDVNYVPSHY